MKMPQNKLYIDVSVISTTNKIRGIRRVVTESTRALYKLHQNKFDVIAIQLINGEYKPATQWLLAESISTSESEQPIAFKPGDILLLLDLLTLSNENWVQTLDRAKSLGVKIYTVVYDLLAIQYPHFFSAGTDNIMKNWFDAISKISDGLICISKHVADVVNTYLSQQAKLIIKPPVRYWHLGVKESNKIAHSNALPIPQTPYLLAVGTFEPRKSQLFILDAMDCAWEKNCELSLCIAGRRGWKTGSVTIQRIENHPLFNKKLFLYSEPNDAQLSNLYSNAAGLLMASIDEGFGLPLIEAASYGVPVICSDIPVFREIMGNYATYFSNQDAYALATTIIPWWNDPNSKRHQDITQMPINTWEQSAETLFNEVMALENESLLKTASPLFL